MSKIKSGDAVLVVALGEFHNRQGICDSVDRDSETATLYVSVDGQPRAVQLPLTALQLVGADATLDYDLNKIREKLDSSGE